jgi:signal transduction histidine kinase
MWIAAKEQPLSNSPAANPLEHPPLPQLAAALRSRISQIIQVWVEQVRQSVPSAHGLPSEQIEDSLPAILPSMADALEVGVGRQARMLMEASPEQGVKRFYQHYDVTELMTEDRLLRRVIIEQTGAALGRRMTESEQVALNTAIDLMLQQAVTAFVDEQKGQLRSAAEAELKYLSFLSHDLNNNLGSVTLMLQMLRHRLAASSEFASDVETLDAAQQSILDTIGGMGRLLQSERLRKAGVEAEHRPVNVHHLASNVARQMSAQAQKKGVSISVEVPEDCVCRSDGELIGLVLQNLVGNAVKFSNKGTVRIGLAPAKDGCALCVSDDGPGISVEHLNRIFDSFRRGESHGQVGVGLGLTIASQAAKLLGAQLGVESKVGEGSTFTLTLPV